MQTISYSCLDKRQKDKRTGVLKPLMAKALGLILEYYINLFNLGGLKMLLQQSKQRIFKFYEVFDVLYFPTGCVRSKKFEQISPKICRAGGIPPKPRSPSVALAKEGLPPVRRSDPFGLDDFPSTSLRMVSLSNHKFFVPLLAELRAMLGLAANSFSYTSSNFLFFRHVFAKALSR